jgi:hypothetical protein
MFSNIVSSFLPLNKEIMRKIEHRIDTTTAGLLVTIFLQLSPIIATI